MQRYVPGNQTAIGYVNYTVLLSRLVCDECPDIFELLEAGILWNESGSILKRYSCFFVSTSLLKCIYICCVMTGLVHRQASGTSCSSYALSLIVFDAYVDPSER